VIRKQIYLKEQHQQAIRNIASARGISEAEAIREAIETQRGQRTHSHPLDPAAWKRALKLMRSLQPRKPAPNKKSVRKWDRAELYEERLSRYGRNTR
jgi:hypothetical protein